MLPEPLRKAIQLVQRSICCILVYDITNPGSFQFIKEMYAKVLKYVVREDLSFTYLIGNKVDQVMGQESVVLAEDASDFAFNHQILFNEVSSLQEAPKNIELILKTLRTRAVRLVSEIGTNLPGILKNLQITI